MYSNMTEILQERQIGIAKIEKYHASGIAAMIQGITEGDYVSLKLNGSLVMSNTPMEKRTNSEFVFNATGDVLIGGLGIGLIIMPLLEKNEVKSITVLEKYQDVIDCVLPQLKPYDKKNKLKVICADCFEWKTKNKYDTIYLDIWAYINKDVYNEEMKPLKRKFRKFLSEDGKINKRIGVWAERQARYEKRLY